MLIRHYRKLHRPSPPHSQHESNAYGGWGDVIVYVAVIVLTTLAAWQGWL